MTTITYDCQEGYKHGVGNWKRTCLENKQWTGTPPMCEEMLCNKPMLVLGATVSHPSLSVHANATYRCSPGYRVTGGDFSHVCQGDGTWSGQCPICEEILCEKIRVPDNSKLLFLSAGLTPGSLTTYKCVPGYTIATGSNETRCTPKGQWDSPLPNCTMCMRARVRACVRAGGKEGDVPEETTYMITITYDCQEGYKQWTGIAPMCEGQSACVRAWVRAFGRKGRRETSLKRRPT
ncbi:hypothetical protein LSAT2_019315 [Lamellibrachia satsuma]|nr:hypothetical protein LSAT2_019315 [Lamellibrachia satsuma]